MDNSEIDTAHTQAICDEIGERLRTFLKPTPDDTADFDDKLDQLSDSEMES